MKKFSIQKLSILGLVLMGASAVTAAVFPANKNDANKIDAMGSITITNEPGKVGSCTNTSVINTPCNNTPSCGPEFLSLSTRCLPSSGNTTAND